MPYIGSDPSNRFVAPKAASVFSGDGSTTAFTLDHAVGSDEDILVSVDGVIQEPSVAYAVSNGTTLTFTAAPSSNSGNNIFVYYLFRTVGTVSHPSNNALTATNGTLTGNLNVTGTTTLSTKLATSNLGAGAVLQIVHTQAQTNQAVTSTSFVALNGYNTAITPSSTSSKILINFGFHAFIPSHTNGSWRGFATRLMRVTGDTVLLTDGSDYGLAANVSTTDDRFMLFASGSFLDSPNTTSATTYGLEGESTTGIGIDLNNSSYGKQGFITLYEIAG